MVVPEPTSVYVPVDLSYLKDPFKGQFPILHDSSKILPAEEYRTNRIEKRVIKVPVIKVLYMT